MEVVTDYTGIGKIQYIAGEQKLPILDSEYTDRVVLHLLVPADQSVNTMNMDGKKKRRGMTVGTTAKTKKAIVALTEDSKDIEIFEGL